MRMFLCVYTSISPESENLLNSVTDDITISHVSLNVFNCFDFSQNPMITTIM